MTTNDPRAKLFDPSSPPQEKQQGGNDKAVASPAAGGDTNMTRTLMLHDGIAPNDNEIPAFKSSKPAAGGGHDDYSEHDYGDK